jgi:hypothetical protein
VVALGASLTALAAAPLLLASSYSWVAHTTSEAAGQGVDGAWLARVGFVAFAGGVVAVTALRARAWGRLGSSAHLVFAGCLVVVALAAARSWEPSAADDLTEDLVHSVAATVMGFAFAIGVGAVGWRRARIVPGDLVAVTASVVLPLGMLALPTAAGLFQRVMFLCAYGWYLAEASSWPARPARPHRSDRPGGIA